MVGEDFFLSSMSFKIIDNTLKLFASDRGPYWYLVCTHNSNIMVCRSCEQADDTYIRAMTGPKKPTQAFRCMTDTNGPTDRVVRVAVEIENRWVSFGPSPNGHSIRTVDLKEMRVVKRIKKVELKPSDEVMGVPGERRRVWDYYLSDKYKQRGSMYVTSIILEEITPTSSPLKPLPRRAYYALCKTPNPIQTDRSEEEDPGNTHLGHIA